MGISQFYYCLIEQVLKYQEEYKLALEAFQRAMLLNPTWEVPRTKFDELLKYLKDVQNSISSKGRLKPKRLYQMIQVIPEEGIY